MTEVAPAPEAQEAPSLEDLERRIVALENKRYNCPKDVQGVDESMKRAREHVESLQLYSVNWKWVPTPYYTWPLTKRAQILNAASTHMLCKSLLLENKKYDVQNNLPRDTDKNVVDPTNPQFLMVIIQYEATLEVKKLITSIRKLRPVGTGRRLEESHFDLRVASSEDNDRITGYKHNSVTPFGLKDSTLPIILSEAIIPHGYFWMGGGHIHLKLGMSVNDFMKVPNVQVMELSVPRTSADDDVIED